MEKKIGENNREKLKKKPRKIGKIKKKIKEKQEKKN